MRKTGLDLCRIVACLAVVMIHTVMLFWDFDPAVPTWALYNFLSLAVRFGVPLFFMISGSLLLGRETLDFKKHLARTGRFVLLFYVWSLICYGLDARFFHIWTREGNFLLLVLAGYYHEWFLPALVLCYCALPLLHGMLYGEAENIRKGVWLLCGTAVLLTTAQSPADKPPLAAALLGPWQVSDLRYLIYFLLGWYLGGRKLSGKALGLLGAAALASLLLFAHLNRRYAVSLGCAVGIWYGYLQLPAALTACFFFCLCHSLEERLAPAAGVLKELSACAFGVYLLHPLAIDALRARHLDFRDYNTLWFFPACCLSFVLLPLGVTWLLRKIPLLRKLVQ